MGQQEHQPRKVQGEVFYAKDTGKIERFHANDTSLDTVVKDPHTVSIVDARTLACPPALDEAGFALCSMPTNVKDWRNEENAQNLHPREIEQFILDLTGADSVVITGPPILRWGERSDEAGTRNNSYAARLVHSDMYYSAATEQCESANPHPGRKIARCAHHNIWRAFSGPPVDVPLAVCDARTVSDDDVIEASADFDVDGKVVWKLPSMNFRFSPRHQWYYYSGMTPDEVLVFKRWDSDASKARFVPHTAFTDPAVNEQATPRASVEMRSIAYWYK
ncbi:MAG: CmcJ/NvfI family oxidoreductase [Sphingomonadaceae bacterium]